MICISGMVIKNQLLRHTALMNLSKYQTESAKRKWEKNVHARVFRAQYHVDIKLHAGIKEVNRKKEKL